MSVDAAHHHTGSPGKPVTSITAPYEAYVSGRIVRPDAAGDRCSPSSPRNHGGSVVPYQESRPCSPEQDGAFHWLFRMVPPYSSEERRWRATTVDAVSRAQLGARRRLQALTSPKPELTAHDIHMTNRSHLVPGRRSVIADN